MVSREKQAKPGTLGSEFTNRLSHQRHQPSAKNRWPSQAERVSGHARARAWLLFEDRSRISFEGRVNAFDHLVVAPTDVESSQAPRHGEKSENASREPEGERYRKTAREKSKVPSWKFVGFCRMKASRCEREQLIGWSSVVLRPTDWTTGTTARRTKV